MRKIKYISQHNAILQSQRPFEANVSIVRTVIIPIYILSVFYYIIFDKLAARYWWPDAFRITGHGSLWIEPLRMANCRWRGLGSVIAHPHCQRHWL